MEGYVIHFYNKHLFVISIHLYRY